MRRVLLVLYNVIAVPLLYVVLNLAGLFNAKIRRGITGRKKLIQKIRHDLVAFRSNTNRIWIHVSSYGEFLQVKPVLYKLKSLNPLALWLAGLPMILTIFYPLLWAILTWLRKKSSMILVFLKICTRLKKQPSGQRTWHPS